MLLTTAWLGFPISTTHVITTSVMGVGATQRLSAVKWGLTFDILITWLVTLPTSALFGAACAKLALLLVGR
ncbi:Phosphate transporter family protein [compost metagenome]